jgi:hypothetical protein
MTNTTHGASKHVSIGAERVARCRQKARMMGEHQTSLWFDKETVDALRVLKDRYEPLSATKIIAHLIKLAANATS